MLEILFIILQEMCSPRPYTSLNHRLLCFYKNSKGMEKKTVKREEEKKERKSDTISHGGEDRSFKFAYSIKTLLHTRAGSLAFFGLGTLALYLSACVRPQCRVYAKKKSEHLFFKYSIVERNSNPSWEL